jgi:hypothetical protein
MGNYSSHPKYYSSKEAIQILGDDTWIRLRNQLKLSIGGSVDYELFSRILYCRFERMVSMHIDIDIVLQVIEYILRIDHYQLVVKTYKLSAKLYYNY